MIYNNNEQLVTELKKCFSIQDTVSETLPNKWAYHPRHSKISLTKSSCDAHLAESNFQTRSRLHKL